jgi:hypothetical protein
VRNRLIHIAFAVVMAAPPGRADLQQQPQRPPYQTRDTWYEIVLKRFNKDDVDYSAWLERRRELFLQATIKNAYFDYSFLATLALILAFCAYAKLWLDDRRKMLVTAEMMTDILNQDRYSRETARAAIAELNEHMERCNRAVEAGELAGMHAGSGSELTTLRTELERIAAELATALRERDKASEELAQKSVLIAEMSLRIDAISRKVDGNGASGQTINIQASNPELVSHINRLQLELLAERQRNKRLKGA